jgi:LysR family glycine cleavage system transcriptional activator
MHRALRLTPSGERYYQTVAPSLQSILKATQELQKTEGRNSVTITTTTGFSTYWLFPRIGEFRRLHPEADLRFLVADNYLDLSAENIDVAIRYGRGDWPNVTSKFLLQEEIFPVCSKAYFENCGPLQMVHELLDERLLHLEGRYDSQTRWLPWFREQGVEVEETPPGIRVNSYTNLVQATLEGQGISLIGPPLIQKYLDDGDIVRALKVTPIVRHAFYLVLPEDREPTPSTVGFCAWIQQAATPPDQPQDAPRRER